MGAACGSESPQKQTSCAPTTAKEEFPTAGNKKSIRSNMVPRTSETIRRSESMISEFENEHVQQSQKEGGDIDGFSIGKNGWRQRETDVYFEAIKAGKVDLVKKLSCYLYENNHKHADVVDSDGRSAIHAVAEARLHQNELTDTLLQAKADIEQLTEDGRSPILTAVEGNQVSLVEHLLSRKASVESSLDYPVSPVLLAVLDGGVELTQTLCEAKADLGRPAIDGSVALTIAGTDGNPRILDELFKHAGSIDDTDTRGHTALMKAAEEGHVECVKLLLDKKADVDARACDGTTALSLAVQVKNQPVAKTLLDAKADPEALSIRGYTALMCAAYNADQEVISTLLAYKADASRVSMDGWHALMCASVKAPIEIVERLYEADTKMLNQASSFDGASPLMWAVRQGRERTVLSLLKYKAEMNRADFQGRNSAWWAVGCGRSEVLQVLMNAKADPTLKDHSGLSALDMATSRATGHDPKIQGDKRRGTIMQVSAAMLKLITERDEKSGPTAPPSVGSLLRQGGDGDDAQVDTPEETKKRRETEFEQLLNDLTDDERSPAQSKGASVISTDEHSEVPDPMSPQSIAAQG